MVENKKSRGCIFVLLLSALFVYLILRGIHVQMIHDSIATFFRYVHIGKFMPYDSEWSANNHFLNSLLMWVSYKIFGASALALKSPNILTFPVYAFFVYKISGHLKNSYLSWGFLLSMLLAHNYFEFFGTGRGYGMSMAFMIAGIWFSIRYLQTSSRRSIILSMVFLFLASYANLTIVNSYIILAGIISLAAIMQGGKHKARYSKLAIILLFGIVPIAFLIMLLLKIQAMGELYYGEPEGLFRISIISLAKLLSGSTSMIIPILGICYYFLSVVLFLFTAIQKKKIKDLLTMFYDPKWIFFLLLSGNIICFNLEHIIFGTDFPEDRTGLFFYPMIIGTIFFGLDQFKYNKKWISLIPVLPLVFIPLHFAFNMNLSWSSHENHSIPERFFDKVAEQHQPGMYPPTISGYKSRIMRWNFLNFRNPPELSAISYPAYPSRVADFLIVNHEEAPDYLNIYDSVDSDPNSRIQLLRRKESPGKELLLNISETTRSNEIDDKYFALHIGAADTLKGSIVYIGFKIDFLSDESPFLGWIVTSISDSNNKDIFYDFIPLYWMRTKWDEAGNTLIGGFLTNKIPDDAIEIRTYIWNIGDSPYTIEDCKIEIFRINQ